jgi:hypothetical protein
VIIQAETKALELVGQIGCLGRDRLR